MHVFVSNFMSLSMPEDIMQLTYIAPTFFFILPPPPPKYSGTALGTMHGPSYVKKCMYKTMRTPLFNQGNISSHLGVWNRVVPLYIIRED